MKLLDDPGNNELIHEMLIGMQGLKNPDNDLFERVIEYSRRREETPLFPDLISCRAIELLGYWGKTTPEVVEIIQNAFLEGEGARFNYSIQAAKRLNISLIL
jgi:hypothetical protein